MSAVPHRVEKCDRKKLSQGGMLTDVATRSTIRVKGETSVSCQLVDRLHDGKNCGHSISCRADTPPPTFDGDLPLRGELERAAASDFIPQPARADGAWQENHEAHHPTSVRISRLQNPAGSDNEPL